MYLRMECRSSPTGLGTSLGGTSPSHLSVSQSLSLQKGMEEIEEMEERFTSQRSFISQSLSPFYPSVSRKDGSDRRESQLPSPFPAYRHLSVPQSPKSTLTIAQMTDE